MQTILLLKKNVIRFICVRLWCVCVCVYHRPIIGHSIGKQGPITIKSRRDDRTANRFDTFESLLDVFVPEIERTIGTCCSECAVWMKAYRVHGIDFVVVTVTFERKIRSFFFFE